MKKKQLKICYWNLYKVWLCQMHSVRSTIMLSFVSSIRNCENEQWTMPLCFVLSELNFKRFVWLHFAHSNNTHTCMCTKTNDERKRERERNANSFLTLFLVVAVVSHSIMCRCVCCIVFVCECWWASKQRLFVVINHIYFSMMWTKVMVSSSFLFAIW